MFFITPQWGELLNVKVWYAAVTQSFFSLSVGFGALFTYSSYNDFKHNVYRDALIISFTDTFTSVLAGKVFFLTLISNMGGKKGLIICEQNLDNLPIVERGQEAKSFSFNFPLSFLRSLT